MPVGNGKLTWLTAGMTLTSGSNTLRVLMLKLDTPIVFTNPVFRSA